MVHWTYIDSLCCFTACGASVPCGLVHWCFTAGDALVLYRLWCTGIYSPWCTGPMLTHGGPLQPVVHLSYAACGAMVALQPVVRWSFTAFGALVLCILWCTGPLQPVVHWSLTAFGAHIFTASDMLVTYILWYTHPITVCGILIPLQSVVHSSHYSLWCAHLLQPVVHSSHTACGALVPYSLWCTRPIQPVVHSSLTACGALVPNSLWGIHP